MKKQILLLVGVCCIRTILCPCVWLILFLTLYPLTVSAQQKVTLSGEVKNSSGEPVYPATIALEGTATGTYTDEKGHYSLEAPAGKRTVVASSVGYEPVKMEVDLRNNQILHFILKEKIISLQGVDVYGKTKTQETREGVFNVSAVDIKSLVNTSASLSHIVNRTTSVRIREEGGVGSDFKLSINGLSGNSVRYFIDGVPLSAMGGGITLANLPTNIVDRIEIYKGVVPTYLGSDALGGAINIITKQEKRNYLDISYGTGSFHTHKFDLNAQFVDTKTGFVVRPVIGLNYSQNDYTMRNMEVWDEEQRKYIEKDVKRFHDDYFSFIAQLEAGFVNRRWADVLLVSATWSKQNKEIQTGNVQTIVYGEARRERESLNMSAQYRKRDLFIEKLDMNLSLSHTRDHSITIDSAYRSYAWDGTFTETYRNEILKRGQMIRNYKRPLTVVRTNFDYALHPQHTFNLNYLLNSIRNDRWDEIDTEFEPSKDVLTKHITGLSYSQNFFDNRLNNSFFVKHYINRLEVRQQDLYWITGAREELGSSTTHYTGYGAGLRYLLHDIFSIKGSYEHSVRLPLANEFLGNGTTIHPNFTLNPENSDNYNSGLFGTWQPQSNHRLYYEAGFFVRKVRDFIHLVLSESDGLAQYSNVENVTIKGMESEVKYEYSDLFQLITNCSYQDARSKTEFYQDGTPQITYNNKIPNQPWLYSNVEATLSRHNLLQKDTRLRLSYYYQYVHWFFLTWEGYGSLKSKATIPTQHAHNLAFSYSMKNEKYNISVECNNLTNRRLHDNYKLQKPGRSFFCKFRLFIH